MRSKPICPDTRKCFGRKPTSDVCNVLRSDEHGRFYKKDRECPFCKPERDKTDGKKYPMMYGENPGYIKMPKDDPDWRGERDE